jgi:predicted small lipoprotein YifL
MSELAESRWLSCHTTRAAMVAATLSSLAACNLPGSLSSSSSCADFNKASAQSEQEIVIKLYHEAHPQDPKTGPAAANAIRNVSYECNSQPSRKLGDLGDFQP